MKFITEDDLRDIYRKDPFVTYEIEPGARLTPGARQFLQDRQINVFADGTAMHVGDGVVAGRVQPGASAAVPDMLKNKRINACLKSTEALFLLTASDLLEMDICMAQEVLQLGKKFEEIKLMVNENKTFEPIPCTGCSGICGENFSNDIGECFPITDFHMQLPKGKQILLLHRLRCNLYEVQITVMEVQCTNRDVTERINQIINRLSQMICTALGGNGCQRTE